MAILWPNTLQSTKASQHRLHLHQFPDSWMQHLPSQGHLQQRNTSKLIGTGNEHIRSPIALLASGQIDERHWGIIVVSEHGRCHLQGQEQLRQIEDQEAAALGGWLECVECHQQNASGINIQNHHGQIRNQPLSIQDILHSHVVRLDVARRKQKYPSMLLLWQSCRLLQQAPGGGWSTDLWRRPITLVRPHQRA